MPNDIEFDDYEDDFGDDFSFSAPKINKNITDQITGRNNPAESEFDPFHPPASDDPAALAPQQPEGDNAIVGVLDMLIHSSGDLLKKYDLPEGNLSVWDEWGKPNLNKAFNAYFPAVQSTPDSPAVAGFIGVAALVLAFLPVILEVIRRNTDKKEKKEKTAEPSTTVPETPPATYEQPEPVRSTAPISDYALSVVERINNLGETV